MNPLVYLIARILLASVFIGLGAERLLLATGVIGEGGNTFTTGALVFSGVELLAGLALVFGWQVRWIAFLLGVFLVVDAMLTHAFWKFAPEAQHGEYLHFLKNLAMVGGLILLSSVAATKATKTWQRR